MVAAGVVIPACAPELVSPGTMTPQDLLSLPLLHLESRPGAWEDWFTRQGCPAGHLRGMLFDQFSQMAEAAALGFGVALLPEFLAVAEFAKGRLVPPVNLATEVDGAYHIVWPQIAAPSRPMQKLLKWLQLRAAT